MKEFRIRELDLNLINPNNLNFSKSDQTGSKIVIIRKTRNRKNNSNYRILYEKRKAIPTAFNVSGTEDSNGHYHQKLSHQFCP